MMGFYQYLEGIKMCMHLAPENKKKNCLDGNLFIQFFFVTRFNYLVVDQDNKKAQKKKKIQCL